MSDDRAAEFLSLHQAASDRQINGSIINCILDWYENKKRLPSWLETLKAKGKITNGDTSSFG
eukprot:scaffold178679_cov38-Cyclotella_meneghiniana.AAC.1